MPKLPVVSYKQAIKAFGKLGYLVDRQRGSHISMYKPGHPLLLTIPCQREIAKGTLRKLIKLADISVAQFVELLGQ